MGTKRDEYVERLKKQIDEWNALIDRWEQEARTRSSEARVEADKRLKDLRARRDDLRERLPEIQEAGEKAFDELLEGVNRAWKELSRAFERSREEFADDESAGSETATTGPNSTGSNLPQG